MVDSLILVETLINVSLAATTGPKNVPFVRLSVGEAVGLTQASHQFCVALQDFVK